MTGPKPNLYVYYQCGRHKPGSHNYSIPLRTYLSYRNLEFYFSLQRQILKLQKPFRLIGDFCCAPDTHNCGQNLHCNLFSGAPHDDHYESVLLEYWMNKQGIENGKRTSNLLIASLAPSTWTNYLRFWRSWSTFCHNQMVNMY